MDIVPVKQLDRVDQFLRSFISENTRIAYQKDLKDYALFSSGTDPISFSTLVQYRDRLIATSAPSTVVRKFSAVKSFLSFLASEGAIPTNPAINLKVPKSRALNPTEAFEDSDVARMLAQADIHDFSGSMHRLALVLLFNTGIRRSELVHIRLRDLTEHRGTRLLSINGKGNKVRFIPMTELVISEINAYLMRYENVTGRELGSHDFLLQSDYRSKNEVAVNASTIYRMVRQYARSAGITKRVSPHSCRATMISHLLEKEVSPRSVADLAGHASIQTTVGVYDRKRDSMKNTAAAKVNYES